MKIEFIASVAVITADSEASQKLYIDALGLPLAAEETGQYFYTDRLEGAKHFGVWSLTHAAEACFGVPTWPNDLPTPQASIEFEVVDAAAVALAAQELRKKGYSLLHDARLEPWGQTVARFLSPEKLIVGISHAPMLHKKESTS